MLVFRLLGQVELLSNGERLGGFRSQKEVALLIYIAHTGLLHRRDSIAELLWDSHSSSQALSNLRTVVARLQQRLDDILIVSHKSLALVPELVQHVDSLQLVQTLRQLSVITTDDDAARVDATLATYHGDFLAGFHVRNAPRFDAWMTETRELIHHQVVEAYHKLGAYAESVGDNEWACILARRLLQIAPLDEVAHEQMIRLLIDTNKIEQAQTHYQRYAELMQQELGVAPSASVTRLIQTIEPQRVVVVPSLNLPSMIRHNMPPMYDQFVGRITERQEIHGRLDQAWCRLVTLVGQGGVGKTRLATMVARERLNHYADGAWFVELAQLDPHDENVIEAIAVEIASALDLRFTGATSPVKQVLQYLQHKHMLLVLDNIEHLLHGMQLVLDIGQRCEHVQLLVTSRERLQVRAEWAIALNGLDYFQNDHNDEFTDAETLFMARYAQHHWEQLPHEHHEAVRAICRMVEGLPLAIELAAALTRHSTPQRISQELIHSFDPLASSLRDVPERHQSLQIVFAMSWHTLTPELQRILARLSVFQGSFSPTAAQAIGDADRTHLTTLVEKSLLVHDQANNRYRLHPVIRAFAHAALPPDDPAPETHTRYFLSQLAKHTEPLQCEHPQVSMDELEPDIENLRLAWNTGLASHMAELLLDGLTSLSIYYQLRGLNQEGETVMNTTVTTAQPWGKTGTALVIRAGLERARFQNRLGHYWQAIVTTKTVVQLCHEHSDYWAEGMAYVWWGESLWRLGKYEIARQKLNNALKRASMINADYITGWAQHQLGIIADIQGNYALAHDHLQKACTIWKSLHNTNTLSVSLNSIGLVRYHQGKLFHAQTAMEHAFSLCQQLDNRHLQALILNNLSIIATEMNDYAKAQHYLQQALELAIASGNLTGEAEIYLNLGRNYHRVEIPTQALEYIEKAIYIAEILNNRTLLASAILNLAEVKHQQNDVHNVISLYRRVLRIAQEDHLKHIECEALIDLAKILQNLDIAEARNYCKEALFIAQSISHLGLIERCSTIISELHIHTNSNTKNLSA